MVKRGSKRQTSSENVSSSVSTLGAENERASSRSEKPRRRSRERTRVVTLEEAEAELATFDWSKIDALTDEQLTRAAAEDPDNPDTSHIPAENWQRYYAQPDLKALRERLGMSQKDFALTFRIAKRTLENWEQGRRNLDGVVSVYLALVAAYPKEIAKLVDGLDRRARRRRVAEAAE